MSTPAQAAASIANCKLSTGPPSSNPTHIPLPGQEAAFAANMESYRKAYFPANQPEEGLVRTIAESYWRLERAHKLENALFQQILKQDDYKDLDPLLARSLAWNNKATGLQRVAYMRNLSSAPPKRPSPPSR